MRNLLVFLVLAASAMACSAQTSKAAKTSLTGCVDERDGEYVLTNDRDLKPTARLRPAAGSAEDNFARHMGEKVTVQGRLSDDQPLPVLTVESLKTVSQTCAPSEAQPK
ncbi:MAG: hypothetical protein ABSH50_14365 [Bryobacteraceae bacterium]|jgi:hypothetical protein